MKDERTLLQKAIDGAVMPLDYLSVNEADEALRDFFWLIRSPEPERRSERVDQIIGKWAARMEQAAETRSIRI